MLEHVVKVEESTLAKDHLNRLASQHALASAYERDGQVKKAIELLEYVVTIHESLGNDHPVRLESQLELARVYHTNGQVEKAIEMAEHMAKINQKSWADRPSWPVLVELLKDAREEMNRQMGTTSR